MHQRVSAAVNSIRRNNVVTRIAELQDRRRNRCHSTGCTVRRFSSFDCGELPTQLVDGRIKMPPIQVATVRRCFSALKKFRHRAWLHDCKSRARLDRHIDATVLAKLVACLRQTLDRITRCHVTTSMHSTLLPYFSIIFVLVVTTRILFVTER